MWAVPFKDGRPDPCLRFEFTSSANGTCEQNNFNREQIVACDGFIMKNNEQRLLSHVRLP